MRKNKKNGLFLDPFWKQKAEIQSSYIYYLTRLTQLCMIRYDYIDIPETINTRYLEKSLMETTMGSITLDPVLGWIGLKCVGGGGINLYGDPIEPIAFGENGYRRPFDEKTGVVIYDNQLRVPILPALHRFAKRLGEIDDIIMINVRAQKTPIALTVTDPKLEMTIKNLYAQYEGNAPMIITDNNLARDSLSVLTTNAPFNAPQMLSLLLEVWNEALSFLGIPNTGSSKRERLVESEAEQSMGSTVGSIWTGLQPRLDAINKLKLIDPESFGNATVVPHKYSIAELGLFNQKLDEPAPAETNTEE